MSKTYIALIAAAILMVGELGLAKAEVKVVTVGPLIGGEGAATTPAKLLVLS